MAKRNVAIVGATGVVGQRLIDLMLTRNYHFDSIRLYASRVGRSVRVGQQQVPVEALSDADFSDIDVAFFTAGTVASEQAAEKAASQGALVIDNTNVFRMRKDVPLIVPQINMDDARERPKSNIIANPNCSTIPVVRALDCLNKRFDLASMVVSTYQAASGAGQPGIDALQKGISNLDSTDLSCSCFETQLAGNLIPHIDVDLPSGATMEEQKLRQESRKILHEPDISVVGTCVRVPVVNCHSAAVYARFKHPVELEEVVAHLQESPEMVVHFANGSASYPQPRLVSGDHNVHVGRLRIDDEDPYALLFWVVSDNLLVGAALNAIQIAEGVNEWGWA